MTKSTFGPVSNRGHVREQTEIEEASDINLPEPNSGFHSSEGTTPLKAVAANSVSNSEKRGAIDRKPSAGTENEAPPSYRKSSNKSQIASPASGCRTMASLPSLRTATRRDLGGETHGLPYSASNVGAYASPARRHGLLLRRQSRVRHTGEAVSPVKSSPGLTAAVERQFGAAMNGSPVQRRNWRDELAVPGSSPAQWSDEMCEAEGVDVVDFAPVGVYSSVNGKSQAMVDSFLKSRRRRAQESPASSSPAMFL